MAKWFSIHVENEISVSFTKWFISTSFIAYTPYIFEKNHHIAQHHWILFWNNILKFVDWFVWQLQLRKWWKSNFVTNSGIYNQESWSKIKAQSHFHLMIALLNY